MSLLPRRMAGSLWPEPTQRSVGQSCGPPGGIRAPERGAFEGQIARTARSHERGHRMVGHITDRQPTAMRPHQLMQKVQQRNCGGVYGTHLMHIEHEITRAA